MILCTMRYFFLSKQCKKIRFIICHIVLTGTRAQGFFGISWFFVVVFSTFD